MTIEEQISNVDKLQKQIVGLIYELAARMTPEVMAELNMKLIDAEADGDESSIAQLLGTAYFREDLQDLARAIAQL